MAKTEKKQSKSLNLDAKSSKKESKGQSAEIVYHKILVSCACGAEYESGSTLDKIRVDVCSNCHPFFTGDSRILDTEGRVEKFKKKYNLSK
jgi:large subunit ribosomal protein L31